jgi:hypothetical protein
MATTTELTAQADCVPANRLDEDEALVRAAESGEEVSQGKIHALLVRNPNVAKRYASLAMKAELAILGDGNMLAQELARAELRKLRASLAQSGDGELEHLLVERAALSWVAVTLADEQRGYKLQGGATFELIEFWDRHVSRLHGDFLRACKTLATARRLRRPGVQVNVVQQLNVAGG